VGGAPTGSGPRVRSTALVGRRPELAALQRWCDAVRAGGAPAVLVHGEAGVGKTALVDHLLAVEAGLTVLRTAGVDGQVAPYTALFDVVGPILGLAADFDVPQRQALNTAFRLGDPHAAVTEHGVALAVAALLARASQHRAVVVAIDDVPWIDTASLRTLSYTARSGLASVGFIFVARTPDAIPAGGLEQLEIAGLDAHATVELLEARRSVIVGARVAEHLATGTRGNPLALSDLARLLTVDQLAGHSPIDEPFPVGPSLEQRYKQRVRALPPATSVALAVAAAEPTGSTPLIERALQALGRSLSDLEPAERDELVTVRSDRVAFNHPLQRSAAYHSSPLATRRRAHRALADVAAAGDAPEARAWHLAMSSTGPDESVAGELEAAAIGAARRAGHAAAAALALRAAELSPDPDDRARRLVVAAHNIFASGDTDAALAWLHDVRRIATTPRATADIDRTEAMILMWIGHTRAAYQLFRHAADRIAPHDPVAAAGLLALGTWPSHMDGETKRARADIDLAVQYAGPDHAATDRDLILAQAIPAIFAGDLATGRAFLEAYPAPGDELDLVQFGQHHVMLAHTWIHLGDLDGAAARQDAVIRAARRWGDLGVVPFALASLCEIAVRQGRWLVADALGAEAVEAGEAVGHRAGTTLALTWLAYLDATRGHEDQCHDRYRRIAALIGDDGCSVSFLYRTATLGQLALVRRRTDEALRHLLEVAERMDDQGDGLPTIFLPWESDLVEAHVRADERHLAAGRLGILMGRAAQCGLDLAHALTARCAGLVAEDLSGARHHFETALDHHRRASGPFEMARTQLCFGEALRRGRQPSEARGHLERALSTFERLGAAPWADLARAELHATGGYTRQPTTPEGLAALTIQERHVADAVGRGLSNPEVATALYLSRKTIEYHLTSIYRKLGVRSRTELVRLLHNENDSP
jgi:DNA-binding CsgD family transcriptional regulator